jgi:hypothetical protein
VEGDCVGGRLRKVTGGGACMAAHVGGQNENPNEKPPLEGRFVWGESLGDVMCGLAEEGASVMAPVGRWCENGAGEVAGGSEGWRWR